jgi:hypothetical protein
VAGDEDDRDLPLGLRHLLLEIEPAEAREPDVEHQAAGHVGTLATQELLG